MTMEKWEELERILKENQLNDLMIDIQRKNKWDRDIRIIMDEALDKWINDK